MTNINSSRAMFYVVSSLTIILSGFFTLISLTEWYAIVILNKADEYRFGSEGPMPYYYETANTYLALSLLSGVSFLLILILGVRTLLKGHRKRALLLFGVTLFLLAAVIINGNIV